MNKVKTSLIRKLLHTRSISRAVRALEKTADADIADLFGSLSPGEVTALVEVLIHAGRAGKVLTEIPLANFLSHIAVGSGDHTNIHRNVAL